MFHLLANLFLDTNLRKWLEDNLLDYIHPEDKALVSYVLNQLDMITEIQPLQYRVRTIDGNYLWMEVTALVIRDAIIR